MPERHYHMNAYKPLQSFLHDFNMLYEDIFVPPCFLEKGQVKT
jgi:hypothetical protein